LEQIKKHESAEVKVAVVDVDGILRGKYMQKEKFLSASKGGFGFCSVIFGWDSGDLTYDNVPFTGYHTGYHDTSAVIDLSTYRQIPWENNIPFFLADFPDTSVSPPAPCPRTLLRKVVRHANDMGYEPLIGVEFEWFNYKETSETMATKQYLDPTPITPGMFGYSLLRAAQNREFFRSILDNMRKFNVPVEGLHTETGPGVYEAAILFSGALEAADRGVLFKAGVKELGHSLGIMPSFMAKPSSTLPGCSGHLHQNLADTRDRKNLFYDEKDPLHMSDLFKSYLAGQLHLLPEFLPFFAPTINSYKRLVDGYWAPTTPTWGVDNRTVGIRVLPGSAKTTRLEFRVTGSDMNPYIAIAASIAAGLWGVKHKLKLTSPQVSGSGYAAAQQHGIQRLPRTLAEATEKLHNSKVAREVLGADFVDHYVETRRHEQRLFENAVTNWEVKRYFEAI
jgi:glutamine synthetase